MIDFETLAKRHNSRAVKYEEFGTLSANELKSLFERTGYKCAACGVSGNETTISVDHIVALNNGGSNTIENIQPLCTKCNSKKSDVHSTNYITGDEDYFSIEDEWPKVKVCLDEILDHAEKSIKHIYVRKTDIYKKAIEIINKHSKKKKWSHKYIYNVWAGHIPPSRNFINVVYVAVESIRPQKKKPLPDLRTRTLKIRATEGELEQIKESLSTRERTEKLLGQWRKTPPA